MKLLKNQVVCFVCREIIDKKDAKEAVSYVEWGSCNSGRDFRDFCCKKHKTDKFGYVVGRQYA